MIELDGSQHFLPNGKASDIERDRFLNGLGIDVVRYSNHEVNTDFSGVYEDIANRLKERTGH